MGLTDCRPDAAAGSRSQVRTSPTPRLPQNGCTAHPSQQGGGPLSKPVFPWDATCTRSHTSVSSAASYWSGAGHTLLPLREETPQERDCCGGRRGAVLGTILRATAIAPTSPLKTQWLERVDFMSYEFYLNF